MKRILIAMLLALSTASDMHAQTSNAGRYANVNGIKMYYEVHGAGRPLVLLHGGGSTIFTTFGTTLPLFARNHQVIAVELQAHGRTSDRNAPESFAQDADDVAELLKQLHIEKADILGFSNGGSTTLQVAIRHPQLVNKLIAVSGIYKRDGMIPSFWPFMQKGSFKDMPQGLKDAFLSVTPDSAKLLNMHRKDVQRMLTFKDWPVSDIRSIKSPGLIIASDQDVVRPEHALEIARLLPHGSAAIFPGVHGEFLGEATTGHPGSKVPALFVAMVDEFLAATPEAR